MLTKEHLDALNDAAAAVSDPINDWLIRDIARRVLGAGQLTSTAAYEIYRAQQLGLSRREIKAQLKKLLRVSNKQIKQLLTQAAETGYNFDIANLPGYAVPFAENAALQQIVASAVKLAQADFTNLTQTIGMIDRAGKVLPLQAAYRSAMDFAFKQVFTGAADYNTAAREATQRLAAEGVKIIDYKSGVHTSLEAATRRCIMGGLGLMQEQVEQTVHDQLGATGWEISAHAASAPDHEPIQGRQYTDAEYETLNGELERRIGTLNCGHVAFPILYGVTRPQYDEAQLQAFREENDEGVTVDGRHYTSYEATQMQRRMERGIRRQKRIVLNARQCGDTDKGLTAKIRLRVQQQNYRRFSKEVGLRTQYERQEVTGFGWREAKVSAADVAKYEKLRYNTDGSIIVTDDWTAEVERHMPPYFRPNAVVDTVSRGGKQRDRMFFDFRGFQSRQISNGPHGNPKWHPFGEHGEHAHDIIWDNGKIVDRPKRNLTDQERKENADIL